MDIDKIADAIAKSNYFVSATGIRSVGRSELMQIIKIIRSRYPDRMSALLNDLHNYHPSTIALDKALQKNNCSRFVDGHCDCFFPDVDFKDCYCKRERKKFLEKTDYRNTKEYREWRQLVFERDDYTCQDCNQRGGDLNAHHIERFKTHKHLRYELANGITICVPCHRKRHGKRNK